MMRSVFKHSTEALTLQWTFRVTNEKQEDSVGEPWLGEIWDQDFITFIFFPFLSKGYVYLLASKFKNKPFLLFILKKVILTVRQLQPSMAVRFFIS